MLTFSSGPLNLEKLEQAPIAVISQSGALAGAIGAYLQGSGIGCSYIVSVGNETCLDALDFLGWVIEQDDVRVVALYIEGLNDAGRILSIAERARERSVQILSLKAGRSAVGQQATASHTGKIASPHAVYSDVLEQAGVISINSLAEALAAVEVLAFLPNPRPGGDPESRHFGAELFGRRGRTARGSQQRIQHTDVGIQPGNRREAGAVPSGVRAQGKSGRPHGPDLQ